MQKRIMLALAWIACAIPVGYVVSRFGWAVILAVIFGAWGAMAFDGLLGTFTRKA